MPRAWPRLRRAATMVAAWTVAALLLWLASRGADWSRAWTLTHTAQPAWLALAAAANLSILGLWAALWRGFLPVSASLPAQRPGYRTFFEIAAITSAIMNTVPMLAGHASAVVLLAQRAGLGAPAALSVLALDQLGEGISKLVVFAAAGATAPLPAWMRTGILSVATAVGVLSALLLVLAHRAPALVQRMPILGAAVLQLSAGGTPLRSVPRALRSLAVALAMKAAEAIAILAVMHAFGLELPWTSALVVLTAVNLATMLPLAPANLGAYEAAAAATYRWLGVDADTALAVAVVQHACFLVPAIGAGVVVLGSSNGSPDPELG